MNISNFRRGDPAWSPAFRMLFVFQGVHMGAPLQIFMIVALFAFIGCDKPAKVDIGELVEAINGLDKDEVVDTDEINTDDDLLVCEEGEKRCESQWVMVCTGGEFVQSEHCVDCGPLCQCVESAGNAWCEHTDPGPDDADVSDNDVVEADVVSDGDGLFVCNAGDSTCEDNWLMTCVDGKYEQDTLCDTCGYDCRCEITNETTAHCMHNDLADVDPKPDEDALLVEDDVLPDDDVDASTISCTADVCTDYAAGLMWQRSNGVPQSQYDAVTYCEDLPLSSFNDWRLPTISELRTIIKGCPDSEADGTCAVVDPGCLDFSCWTDVCYCEPIMGPGENGFYWEPGVWDTTTINMEGASCLFWSSSVQTDATTSAWDVDFRQGFVYSHGGRGDSRYVRCVRDAILTRTTKQWGTSATEYGHSVAVDSNGNIFVAGRIDGDGVDAYLTKWNADGTHAWNKQWGTIAADYGWSVAVDSSGNIFVAGSTSGDLDGNTNAGGIDIFLTKWNADGTKAWTKQWGTELENIGNAVATDGDGNIFVTGTTRDSLDGNPNLGASDIFLTKWSPSGTKIWTKQWGSTAGEIGYGIAVDGDGNVFITGQTDGSFDGNTNAGGADIFLTKWNADGTKAWTKMWGAGASENGASVVVDADGNIFVTGNSSDAMDGNTVAGGRDIFLTKLNATGEKQWTKQWGTTLDDFGEAVAVDLYGHVYVTGYTEAALDGNDHVGGRDIFLTKYSSDGTNRWTKQWGTAQEDIGYGVAIDQSGRIIVAGLTREALDGNTFLGEIDAFLSIFSWE